MEEVHYDSGVAVSFVELQLAILNQKAQGSYQKGK
jgi:hypothetical protein